MATQAITPADARTWRRAFLWLYLLTAAAVCLGVLVQAFTIAAYVRGAGAEARDLHLLGAYITHSLEFVAFLAALVGLWGQWKPIGRALLLPVVGTIQVFAVGDTAKAGGWVNGLHGLLALIVLLLAAALAREAWWALARSGHGT